MNQIVIDLNQFPKPVQEALKDQAIKEKKPLKQVLAEIIKETSETIVATSGEEAA